MQFMILSPKNSEGFYKNTVDDPTLTLPLDGDYKALPRSLMYELLSMPNRLASIKEGLAATAESSFPPDYFEYYEYRERHWSKLGLKALDLINALCRQYKIPPPELPEHYSPRESFRAVVAKVEENQQWRSARNAEMIAKLSGASAAQSDRNGEGN